MIVVSDTSAISGLALIGRLDLSPALYGSVCIPQRMHLELTRLSRFGYDTSFLRSPWLQTLSISNQILYRTLNQHLDAGELEAITLALELGADWLLIDETAGRKEARKLNLNIIGLLGILVEAKRHNLLPAIQPTLDDLITKAGFRVSHSLYEQVLRDAGER